MYKDGEIISKSANRLPPIVRARHKIASEKSLSRYHYIEHAERCAIFDAANKQISLHGATMYCTRFPCSDCARTILYFGIKRLVVPSGFGSESDWVESQRFGLKLLRKAGITVRYLKV